LTISAALTYTIPIRLEINRKFEELLETDIKLKTFAQEHPSFAQRLKCVPDVNESKNVSPYKRTLQEKFAPHIRQAIEPLYQQRVRQAIEPPHQLNSWPAFFASLFKSSSE
ncbi:MAG: hypothetical protein ACHQUC_05990, partial [Chlamydiales bacterium]